jgi:predicted nucleotidyltransferase
MIEINAFLENIVSSSLIQVDGLQAIVLGGSWATNTQRPDSDIDLGLYYFEDTPLLNTAWVAKPDRLEE